MIESPRKLVFKRGRERYEACDDEASEKSRRKQTNIIKKPYMLKN